ncbi:MAG: hypothetical protein EZS28_049087, partial [Streblomastix strix]
PGQQVSKIFAPNSGIELDDSVNLILPLNLKVAVEGEVGIGATINLDDFNFKLNNKKAKINIVGFYVVQAPDKPKINVKVHINNALKNNFDIDVKNLKIAGPHRYQISPYDKENEILTLTLIQELKGTLCRYRQRVSFVQIFSVFYIMAGWCGIKRAGAKRVCGLGLVINYYGQRGYGLCTTDNVCNAGSFEALKLLDAKKIAPNSTINITHDIDFGQWESGDQNTFRLWQNTKISGNDYTFEGITTSIPNDTSIGIQYGDVKAGEPTNINLEISDLTFRQFGFSISQPSGLGAGDVWPTYHFLSVNSVIFDNAPIYLASRAANVFTNVAI